MRYDFVEIGTSDFDTLIEQADDNTVGISVEPLKYYLDRLPDKPLVKKLNVAISSKDSAVEIYYIPEDKIVKHNLPYWVRGSNSVGKPHPFTIKEIGKELYDQIVQVKQVKCISMKTLVTDNDVTGIQLLKIDTEGMDHIILRDFLDLCEDNRSLLPAEIKFERNPSVSNMHEITRVMERLRNLGYNVEDIGNDVICNMQTLQTLQIPRIIHQTFKTNMLPPDLQKAVNGLKNMNPTFEYRFYNDQACLDFIRDNYPQEYLDDYLSINSIYGAARADFFRYLVMYKEGGVYLDIKSATTIPLEETLLPTDEYILTHWEGKDWAEELGYYHGEFQNWHIICRPGHPFLKEVIESVRTNLKSYNGERGKLSVLRLTGPIAYSKAILNIFNDFDRYSIGSPIREFATADEIGLTYMATGHHHHTIYPDSCNWDEPIVLRPEPAVTSKHPKAYVLYANTAYIDTVKACVRSLNNFSKIPVYVYLLNNSTQIEGATTIDWRCNVPDIPDQKVYIDRKDPAIYRMMIERPRIVQDCLSKYADTVCYVDADSVATQYVDNIFSYYPENSKYPYFVEGIYDYLHVDGRGGAETREDMSTTLEAPACELFDVNQYVRQRYRQTGYFVAGESTYSFLDEWYRMCLHPKVLASNAWYAPYNEETLANVLLWKYKFFDGLPYIYCNADLLRLQKILSGTYEYGKHHKEWFRLPATKEELMFIHGEKSPGLMDEMTELMIHKEADRKPRIMFLAPHLSTGGMPAFLQKRIESLQAHAYMEIFVVEYQCYSMDFVVQRDAIRSLVGDNFVTLYENKLELFKYIRDWQPDVIHIDEMSERLDHEMVTRLYASDRKYKVIETCHDVSFDPATKVYQPDAYAFCTPYHLQTFKNMESLKKVILFPIDGKLPTLSKKIKAQQKLAFDPKKTHVLNVGLWTPGKNQGEGLEIARQYPDMMFHFVGNRAGNFAHYWQPLMNDIPANVKIWDERSDVPTFYTAADIFMFNSTWECNPLALREAISYGLPIIARQLPQYEGMFDGYLQSIDTDLTTIKRDYDIPSDNTSVDFAKNHVELYKIVKLVTATPQTPRTITKKISVSQHYVERPYIEIRGEGTDLYTIKVFDEKGKLYFQNDYTPNHYVELYRRWFTKWHTEIWKGDQLVYESTLDYTGQRVYIAIDSEALGDTLAWIPYALEFQNKHKCHVIVSTFKNELFRTAYPELEFVKPGIPVPNILGMYKVGYFYDKDKDGVDFPSSVPLQKTACNILGLEYKEVLPRIAFTPKKRLYSFKYVTIATNSTSGCKYWQKPDWQKVIDYMISKGYKVINVSKERNPFRGAEQIKDTSMENTMHTMYHADFMIGLSSGLSWLNWAMGKRTVLISNFTNEDYEFKTDCIRITNKKVCHDCWSTNKLDMGNWDWCPLHEGTERHFECQRAITGDMVINRIRHWVEPGTDFEEVDAVIPDKEEFDWGWMNTPEGILNRKVIEREMQDNSYERYFEVEEGDFVLDIGASVGTFPWSIVDKKPAHIYCLEPSSVEFPTLQKNMKDLPVTCVNQGVWYKDGLVRYEHVFGPDKSMPCVTFDTLRKSLNNREIDFLKCDCEGGEYYIFTGEHLFFLLTKVKKIAVEFHLGSQELKPKFREFRDTILKHIKGYIICDINGKEITDKVFTEEFISYYSEIMIYIDNR